MTAEEAAALTGLVGGIAGFASLVWTVVWSIAIRPRVRWRLNRFEEQPLVLHNGPEDVIRAVGEPMHFKFYFRNTGGLAADDAHAIVSGGTLERPTEFPANGRARVEPDGEILISVHAKIVEGALANRPYIRGTDNVLALKGVTVKLRWQRHTLGYATRRFNLDKRQLKVPLV